VRGRSDDCRCGLLDECTCGPVVTPAAENAPLFLSERHELWWRLALLAAGKLWRPDGVRGPDEDSPK
jgi:hypothetical protein